jgi:hypothetical protein
VHSLPVRQAWFYPWLGTPRKVLLADKTSNEEYQEYSDAKEHTVKKVDEVVRYPHLVTQDQFSQVSKKFPASMKSILL